MALCAALRIAAALSPAAPGGSCAAAAGCSPWAGHGVSAAEWHGVGVSFAASQLPATVNGTALPAFALAVPADASLDPWNAGVFRAAGVMSPVATIAAGVALAEACGGPSAPLVIDAGANCGYFSALAAALGCRAWALEPQPQAHRLLALTSFVNAGGAGAPLIRADARAAGEATGAAVWIEEPAVLWGGARTARSPAAGARRAEGPAPAAAPPAHAPLAGGVS
eukprot:TRINITY_DN26181_c0_g1_i2.p3 TRINITY_DN26181_c0_g1~~TRINITY_DN26181_c0_g1_i2.p3  ORF type:complete len:253 (+),score=60.19 TRINITY_DN26181_c0_g1_i2:89-760(+)